MAAQSLEGTFKNNGAVSELVEDIAEENETSGTEGGVSPPSVVSVDGGSSVFESGDGDVQSNDIKENKVGSVIAGPTEKKQTAEDEIATSESGEKNIAVNGVNDIKKDISQPSVVPEEKGNSGASSKPSDGSRRNSGVNGVYSGTAVPDPSEWEEEEKNPYTCERLLLMYDRWRKLHNCDPLL
ncbi:hypothetical protein BSKO_10129 [Bryopsis sp. KO-2023]|nr:hypothetical protein BSKO_10129 [Bryopsis sp. KO-2023]